MAEYEGIVQQIRRILEHKAPEEHVFLISADLVEFKRINYLYGAEKGTELLRSVEKALETFPSVRFWERLYADRFVFAVVSRERQIGSAVIRCSEQFTERYQKDYKACNLRIACGICRLESENNICAVLDEVNEACKKAKRQGPPYVYQTDSSLIAEYNSCHDKEVLINRSLAEEQFCYLLQPRVNLLTGEIVGAEALARRVDTVGNIIFPDAFVEVMEQNGSIIKLDFLILRQVCKDMARRLQENLPVVPVSVNLSRLHTGVPDTARRIHEIVRQYKIPVKLLEFELTETILLTEFGGTKHLMDELRRYGYHVSIDDFGSGYAGINLWQEMDFDVLKLDKRFLCKELEERNAVILPNVINIAQRLNIEVVCEGVENEEQCAYLRQMGCTMAQGFWFSQPVTPERFYREYQNRNGHFPVEEKKPLQIEKRSQRRKRSVAAYVFMFLCCAAFLVGSTIAVFAYYMHKTEETFNASVNENLDAYLSAQVTATGSRIENIVSKAKSCVVLAERKRERETIDSYVHTVNEEAEGYQVLFVSSEEAEELETVGNPGKEEAMYQERLRQGETIVTDIRFSHQAGDIYCFSVCIPVIAGTEYRGYMQVVVDAELLMITDQIVSPYGEAKAAFLIDGEGNAIKRWSDNKKLQNAVNLEKILLELFPELSGEKSGELRSFFEENRSGSVRLGELEGIPCHLSVAEVPCGNNWRLVVLFEADKVPAATGELFRQTELCVGILMAATLLVCGILFLYFRKMQNRVLLEQKRYMLLEEFTDTVLFDYDCKHDFMHFTSNVTGMFQTQGTEIHNFSKNLTYMNIYPGDVANVKRAMLGGGVQEEHIRIRLKRPEAGKNEYFWCMVQYIYILERGKPVSVIGKIIDIDEQKTREEKLELQASLDGLTRIYNKTSTEERVRTCLSEDSEGVLMLFDVDNFKSVNDVYGHVMGDQVLCTLADLLKEVFGSVDIIGRIGGDEFLVYIQENCAKETVQKQVDELRNSMKERFPDEPCITLSTGVAHYPTDGKDYTALFRAADQSMYQAKHRGKDCCFFAGEVSETVGAVRCEEDTEQQ